MIFPHIFIWDMNLSWPNIVFCKFCYSACLITVLKGEIYMRILSEERCNNYCTNWSLFRGGILTCVLYNTIFLVRCISQFCDIVKLLILIDWHTGLWYVFSTVDTQVRMWIVYSSILLYNWPYQIFISRSIIRWWRPIEFTSFSDHESQVFLRSR